MPASDDEVPEASQWVWCCVSARYGNQVWQHSQIENHPDGLRFRAAGPLRPNDAGIRIFSGGTEIRLKKTGLVSNQALVLGAAPSCVAPQHPSTGSQPASRGRSYTDSNTLDPSIPDGTHIPIEERSENEVLNLNGVRVAAQGIRVRNPGFDVTPWPLIAAIVTEQGVHRPGPDGYAFPKGTTPFKRDRHL